MATDALSIPFLTALDSRAALKGSRDALGAQQLWTKLGRTVIGNLTTVSNSARDFTITLLGHHFAEVVASDMPSSSRLVVVLDTVSARALTHPKTRVVAAHQWLLLGE